MKHWKDYSKARDEMFARTHTTFAPWTLVRTDDKHSARLDLIKAILASVDYKGKDERLLRVDPRVAFSYEAEHTKGRTSVP